MILNKIRNSKGITIIHAMVCVLIFAIIGSLIYESAMSNLDSFNKEKRYQQTCMAVSSAANLFMDAFKGDSVEFTLINNGTLTTDQDWKYDDKNLQNPIADADFVAIYKDMFTNRENVDYKVYKDYTITASNGTVDFDEVTVHVIFSQYRIYANFYVKGGNPDGNNSYMCCEIPITIEEGEVLSSSTFVTMTNKIVYDFDTAAIYKGSYED